MCVGLQVQLNDLEAIASLLSIFPHQVAVVLVLLWAFLRLRRTQSSECLQGKKVLA